MRLAQTVHTAVYQHSALGTILMHSDGSALVGLEFASQRSVPNQRVEDALLDVARQQLDEYFLGQRRSFTFPLAMHGTEFQRATWQELMRIPYGQTISYAELARRLGREKAFRAVGSANGANPIAIVVPCHRVIAKTGSLGGYAGGVTKKRLLLQLEGVVC